MRAKIFITLKSDVLDPQGRAIVNALNNLGFSNVQDARQGKYIELLLTSYDQNSANTLVDSMCKQLLANTVIEDYSFEIVKID
jgi:phosphoribosylformylglycinamidine synthase PurS subunit